MILIRISLRDRDEIPSLDGYATEEYVDEGLALKQNTLTAGANISISGNVISAEVGLHIEVVQTLPATGEENVIYLVPNGGETPNIYDEFVWIVSTSTFEKIGTTEIDLSQYYTKTEIDAKETDVKEDIQELQTDVSDLESGKQDKATTGTFTLAVASWSNNQQTVNVTGVTATSKLFVNPQTASKDDWAKYGIWGIAQADGTITFSCKEVPAVAINGQVVIL